VRSRCATPAEEPIVALKNAHGLHLAGLEVARPGQYGAKPEAPGGGSAGVRARCAERYGVAFITEAELDEFVSTTNAHYVFDVRLRKFQWRHRADSLNAPAALCSTDTYVACARACAGGPRLCRRS